MQWPVDSLLPPFDSTLSHGSLCTEHAFLQSLRFSAMRARHSKIVESPKYTRLDQRRFANCFSKNKFPGMVWFWVRYILDCWKCWIRQIDMHEVLEWPARMKTNSSILDWIEITFYGILLLLECRYWDEEISRTPSNFTPWYSTTISSSHSNIFSRAVGWW